MTTEDERRWAAKQNWHDLGLEGLGEIPDDLLPLQERWIRGEIPDAEFRAGVVALVRKTAPSWSPAPGSVLTLKE
jgi:hypothetical protein